ncbi:hypothetical protein [Paraburkholderia phenoliruptrix]|uniref:hypothetical protein n=1 Tax=Paraburkholderia phenoliruptrix TaxID=252970 RepID=UPI0034CF5019
MNQTTALSPEQNQPFQRMMANAQGINAGAVAIESERAIAEARGQMQLAKMFPRDLNAAYAELMDACKLPALAEVAFYNVPQGGSKVSGPSIRLAEEVARVYGNFEFGHRELSRVEATPDAFGRSEIEVYAWDKEKNNRSIRQITVLHVLDTKDGPRRLRDQKDIDNKIANVASKQARGRILALMPKWFVEAAVQQCKRTLAGNNELPLSERIRRMTQAFAPYGVTAEHLEHHLGHPLDQTLSDELVDLTGIFNALKEGAKPSEYFQIAESADTTGAELTQQARQAAQLTDQTQQQQQQTLKAEPQQRARRAATVKKAETEAQPEQQQQQQELTPPADENQHAAAEPAQEQGEQQQPQAAQTDVF